MKRAYVGQEYAVATNNRGLQQTSRWHQFLTRFAISLAVLVMAVSVAIIAFCVVYFLSPIVGTSMMTTLNATGQDTDSALVCRTDEPVPGNIIITKLYIQDTGENVYNTYNLNERYPNEDANGHYMYIIKRLIAVGGDQITMTREAKIAVPRSDADYNYAIYVNGELLNEPYLNPEVGHPSAKNFIQLWRILHEPDNADLREDWQATDYQACVKDGVLTIPAGYWFLMGDNRGGNYAQYSFSWDSAYLGPQSSKNLVGVCVDIVDNQVSLPHYLWDKIVYYVFFGWAWQR